eukprot:scaffold1474_cov256-Pinguiococcus_pyrenoidosus.AAC.5
MGALGQSPAPRSRLYKKTMTAMQASQRPTSKAPSHVSVPLNGNGSLDPAPYLANAGLGNRRLKLLNLRFRFGWVTPRAFLQQLRAGASDTWILDLPSVAPPLAQPNSDPHVSRQVNRPDQPEVGGVLLREAERSASEKRRARVPKEHWARA